LLVDDALADELIARAEAEGIELLGPGGLLRQMTKAVLERALNEELTGHLGYERHERAGGGNARNGTTPKRLITEYGVRGFKFHPNAQEFYPNAREVYPLYEVIAEHGCIALFHTGHTGVGAGTRGGGGIRLKYSNPMFLDDVAVDFPDMPIIMAHPSFPWQEEALSVALHKPQVYIDLSGWSPKYFSPSLVQYANTLLKHKVLFGSDYPVITPDRWLADFEKIDIRPDVRPLILKENAAKLFGLAGEG